MARSGRQLAGPSALRTLAADPAGVLRPPTRAEERGLRYLSFGLILAAALLGGRLAYLQVFRHGFYMQAATELNAPSRPEAVRPGLIYDDHMRALADAQAVADLAIDPQAARTKDTDKTKRALVEVLGLSPEVVDAKLGAAGQYERLAWRVPAAIVQKLQALQLPALVVEPGFKRVYPYGPLGAHVLGAYSGDQRPLEGLDLKYRFLLAGRPRTPRRNVDAWGRTIVGTEGEAALPSEPGKSLVTTLDLDLQRQVESALDRLWSTNRPENATVVVLEPSTGAVLALACRPTFNPNDLAPSGTESRRPAVQQRDLRNLPVCWEYEPGSTFKVLTAAAALQYGAVSLNSTFHCGGTMMVGGRPLHCWGPWQTRGHGTLDLAGILAQSCNLGAAQVVTRLGRDHFTQFLATCGFGRRTGVGLPGEAAGQVYPADQLRVRDLANMGFGQHILVTPLQLTAAIGAVVNDGVYCQPQLVRRVLNADGTTVFREIAPRSKVTVCSPEVSRQVRQMMIGVVERGTGRLAHINGVAVGGKTGTAQVFDPATGTFPDNQKVVSFVLVAPADRRPDFIILVTAKNPEVGQHGSDVCAPAAKEIATYLLRRQGLLPEG
jgi:stage V sporulation protein D (sporulation-specific penicillin-binding protein)